MPEGASASKLEAAPSGLATRGPCSAVGWSMVHTHAGPRPPLAAPMSVLPSDGPEPRPSSLSRYRAVTRLVLRRTLPLVSGVIAAHALGGVVGPLVAPALRPVVTPVLQRLAERTAQRMATEALRHLDPSAPGAGYGQTVVRDVALPGGVLAELDDLEARLAAADASAPRAGARASVVGRPASTPASLAGRGTAERGGVRVVAERASAEVRRAAIRRLAASPYADTLRQVLGWPAHGLTALTPAQQAAGLRQDAVTGLMAGAYQPGRDLLQLDPARPDAHHLRVALAHELTHRLQAVAGPALGPWWAAHVDRLPEATTYARAGVLEHQAEAMGGAAEWLAIAAAPLPARAALARQRGEAHRRRLLALEARVPGTVLMVRVLLSHPLYAEHPLRTGQLVLGPDLLLTPLSPPWSWAELQRVTPGGPLSTSAALLANGSDPAVLRATVGAAQALHRLAR